MKEGLTEQSETGCCPRFNPEPWDEKQIAFEDKLFLKDHVRSFLHIPLNIGRVMAKNMARIEEAGALAPEQLVLSDENSLWGSDIYIAVSKEVPGAEMAKLSETFLSKVFEGPYSQTGKWVKEMKNYVESQGKELKNLYFFYTTCPKCAKVYGKNYVVLLAAV
jgi:hypothetical protein